MCVLIFPTNLSETFLILRRTERVMIKNLYRSSHKLPTILSILMIWIFSTDFFKHPEILNFMKICQVLVELFHADGRTDITKLTVVIHNFANASENDLVRPIL
jgi:hypothetical protein